VTKMAKETEQSTWNQYRMRKRNRSSPWQWLWSLQI